MLTNGAMSPLRTYLLASVALLASCDQTDNDASPAPPTASATLPPTLTVADPPLTREALLLTVVRTASDFAAGRSAKQRELDGKRFEVALRFGCPGDNSNSQTWLFDEAEQVLRIRAEPQISLETPLLRELGYNGFEAAEGFWIRRPWLLQAACPARPAAETPRRPADIARGEQPVAEPPSQTVPALPQIGLAQFYTDEDSRISRRDSRAYEATVQLAEGAAPSWIGYDLVLSGRLNSLPDGRVIACGGNSDAPPSCIVSVRFDHVRLQAADGSVISDWTAG